MEAFSVLLEIWPVRQLLAFSEHKVLRTIFGAMREGDSWKHRYNFELERDFAEPNIVAKAKVQRLRWAWYLARMNDDRAPATLFGNNPVGR